jgi:ectoine hydroxylase-related dioxygenase (phytanoyl-CoA dioxygenase family)
MATYVEPSLLSPEQIERYHAAGYLHVRAVFDGATVAELAGCADALSQRQDLIDIANLRCRWQPDANGGECVFDCFDPVIDLSPICRRVAEHERLLALLRALYDDEPCLLKDKLIFKRPGAHGYGLHQDYIAWREFPRSFTTAMVAIDPADAENGATEVFAGCHRQGYMSAHDGEYHEISPDALPTARGEIPNLEPGDVLIFGGFTPHRSGPNRSQRWRRQLYLSYNATGDGGSQRADHYRLFHDWLRERYARHGLLETYFR